MIRVCLIYSTGFGTQNRVQQAYIYSASSNKGELRILNIRFAIHMIEYQYLEHVVESIVKSSLDFRLCTDTQPHQTPQRNSQRKTPTYATRVL